MPLRLVQEAALRELEEERILELVEGREEVESEEKLEEVLLAEEEDDEIIPGMREEEQLEVAGHAQAVQAATETSKLGIPP